jgi:aryl-alcohol dehydrogenase-like predicted oxidoreductase
VEIVCTVSHLFGVEEHGRTVVRYKLLGKSGMRVSEICLGTLTFGEERPGGASKAESARIFTLFAEAGGNFVDTSNRYVSGTSEEYLGEFVASERESFVLATKYTLSTRRGDVNASGNHRKNMVQALEASLRRLRTEYVDLYLVHAWDFTTPAEELMRALDDMVRIGKVLHVGISNAPAWVVSRANTLAELRGWTPFVNLQVEYSLVQRESERELLPMALDMGIGVTAFSPLGTGLLAKRYNGDLKKEASSARKLPNSPALDDRNLSIVREVSRIADEIGCSPSQVALNWLRQQKASIIPIIGAENADQAKENLDYLKFELSEEHVRRLDRVSGIELGFPHDFLAAEETKERVYGGMHNSIDFGTR